MRVLIADDPRLVRDALEAPSDRTDRDATVVTAGSLSEAIDVLASGRPMDCIVLDANAAGSSGLEGLERMRARLPSLPVVITSGLAAPDRIRDTLARGPAGASLQAPTRAALPSALRLVIDGEVFVPVSALAAETRLLRLPTDRPAPADEPALHAPFTRREREVLHHLVKGCSNKEIARALDVREVTIKLHVRGLCRKLSARNRTHAAMRAVALGFGP